MDGMASERRMISRSPRGLVRCSADWIICADRRMMWIFFVVCVWLSEETYVARYESDELNECSNCLSSDPLLSNNPARSAIVKQDCYRVSSSLADYLWVAGVMVEGRWTLDGWPAAVVGLWRRAWAIGFVLENVPTTTERYSILIPMYKQYVFKTFEI